MEADRRKKRLNSNSLAGCSSHELHKTKNKSLTSLQFHSLMRPHISLELDRSRMRVVPKRGQIGLSRRDMVPYSKCVSHHHKTLADVITLPEEIFDVGNLESVFSYGVWRELLSEDERVALSQFLPNGGDTDTEVVKSLFDGNNFSFGNPVLKWCNMLASGNLHPDAIIQRDHSLYSNQKAYCSKLQDYHNGMLRNLLQLKDMWDGCQDPLEFVPNLNRTSNPTVNGTLANTDDYKVQNPDYDLGDSCEPLSSMEYDQACSSEDHVVKVARSGEGQKRRSLKLENTRTPLLTRADDLKHVVRPKNGDVVRNCNILDNGANYMACVKISKKQYELLKSMKQPGKGIQSKSVKEVLGNLSRYCVQPFAIYEEEQQRKLREQWLLVVNAVAQASAEWRVRQTHKEQIAQLLYQDIKDNVNQVLQDEKYTGCEQTMMKCCGRTDTTLNMDDYVNTIPVLPKVHDVLHHSTVGGDFERNDVGSAEKDGSQTTDLIPSNHDDSMLEMRSDGVCSNGISATYVHVPPDFPCTLNSSFDTLSRYTQSGVGSRWLTSKISLPSHQSTFAGGYTHDVSKIPYPELQSNLDHHPQFHNSEAVLLENGAEPGMPYSVTNQQTFSAYQNEDRSGMLMPTFSSPEHSFYKTHNEQATPHFQQAHNVLTVNKRFPIQYQESIHQAHPLDADVKIDEQFYVSQHLSVNMHDQSRSISGSSFSMQEQLPPLQLQDWHASSVGMAHMPLPTKSHAGDFSTQSQNWHSGQQIHVGWSSTPNEVSILSQSVRNETCNNDGSLFSVLSQCKDLRSSTYDHHMDSTGHGMGLGDFEAAGRNTHRNSDVIHQIADPLEFYRGTGASPSLPPNSVGWVNIPQQTSGLPDPLGKPFLRSWNQ